MPGQSLLDYGPPNDVGDSSTPTPGMTQQEWRRLQRQKNRKKLEDALANLQQVSSANSSQ